MNPDDLHVQFELQRWPLDAAEYVGQKKVLTLILGRSRKFLATWMEILSRKAGEM